MPLTAKKVNIEYSETMVAYDVLHLIIFLKHEINWLKLNMPLIKA